MDEYLKLVVFRLNFFWFFETGFLCVALEPILALAVDTKLTCKSQRYSCLCLVSAGIKDVSHHHPVR